jgi:hypothetical protein
MFHPSFLRQPAGLIGVVKTARITEIPIRLACAVAG